MTFDVPRRLCRRAFRRFYRRYALQRIARRAEVRLLGCRLMTDPEVLHPIHFLSTRVLMNAVMTLDLAEKRFLDMGSGSGAIGIVAASRGAVVTACDINPRAVAVSRENATRNGARLEVLHHPKLSPRVNVEHPSLREHDTKAIHRKCETKIFFLAAFHPIIPHEQIL